MKKEKNNFARAVDWLIENKKVKEQKEIAQRMHMTPASISRIKNGRVKQPDPETIRRFGEQFGEFINIAYIRGESDVMLAADLASSATAPSGFPAGMTPPVPGAFPSVQPSLPDYSSLVNSIIAAKDDAITSLKRELDSKDDTIAAKDALIATKDALIATLQRQINDLRTQVAIEKGLVTGYPFAPGVAEQDQHRPSI